MTVQSLYPIVKPALLLDFANSKKLDPRITFTRASTATYYDGKTFAKAEENLLLNSQNLTGSGWGLSNISVAINQTGAPDGTSTSNRITAAANLSFHQISQAVTAAASTTYTASFFVKAGTHQYLYFVLQTRNSGVYVSNIVYVTYNLTTQTTVGTPYGTYSITSVGNDWYRVTLTGTMPASGANQIAPTVGFADNTANLNITLTGTETFFAWGAQLEQRSTVTSYTPTTTQPITNYIPVLQSSASGQARFDHDPITSRSKGLLIEEQRTNLLVRSEEFDNASWTKSRSSITDNTIVAPDGTLTGDKLVESTDTNSHGISQSISVTSTYRTASVYLKAGERTAVRVEHVGNTGNAGRRIVFDLSTGSITNSQTIGSGGLNSFYESIQSVGNGWYRIQITIGLNVTTGNTAAFLVFILDGAGNISYTGDGYSGIYIWGAQLEQGQSPTSYIPTVASQVTRSVDSASISGDSFTSFINQAEGTLLIDIIKDTSEFGNRFSAALYTSSTNYLGLDYSTNSIDIGSTFWRSDSSGSYSLSPPSGVVVTSSGVIYAAAYSYYDLAIGADGKTTVFGTPTKPNPNFESLQLGRQASGAFVRSQIYFKKVAYYRQRLTNAQLQTLTT